MYETYFQMVQKNGKICKHVHTDTQIHIQTEKDIVIQQIWPNIKN